VIVFKFYLKAIILLIVRLFIKIFFAENIFELVIMRFHSPKVKKDLMEIQQYIAKDSVYHALKVIESVKLSSSFPPHPPTPSPKRRR